MPWTQRRLSMVCIHTRDDLEIWVYVVASLPLPMTSIRGHHHAEEDKGSITKIFNFNALTRATSIRRTITSISPIPKYWLICYHYHMTENCKFRFIGWIFTSFKIISKKSTKFPFHSRITHLFSLTLSRKIFSFLRPKFSVRTLY